MRRVHRLRLGGRPRARERTAWPGEATKPERILAAGEHVAATLLKGYFGIGAVGSVVPPAACAHRCTGFGEGVCATLVQVTTSRRDYFTTT